MIITPLQSFLQWEKETPEKTFLRQPIQGTWHVYTYASAGGQVRRIATALRKLDLPRHSKIAILSKNCAHWLMADLAIMMAGFVSVPVYPTLSASGIKEILDHSEASAIFLGKLDNFEIQKPGLPEGIIQLSFPHYGVTTGLLWEKLVNENEPLIAISPPAPESLATIMYSSGTTGTPKGIMLTHGAFGFVGDCVRRHLGITKPERFFSYLPLSHIAERALMEMVALSSGSSVSFAESLDKFQQNLQHERPTIFGGVPRIYAKFQEGILQKLPQRKLDRLLSIPFVNNLIRKKIRSKLGLAEARVIVSGAAPTPSSLLHWFKKLAIPIREIYGMTENTAFSHANFREIRIGTVGQPWPEVEAKLSDDGEILVRHKALMTGYFNDPETTSKVFTNDGFLKTGDQGSIDSQGFLTIIGRVKDQFKTDKAKFVAPAPIEMRLLSNPDLEQVCVVGMGLPQPIALVVLTAAAKGRNRQEIASGLSKTVDTINQDLEHYEQLEKAVILPEGWTLENGLLTPSLKIKRNEIERMYLTKYKHWYDQKPLVIWD